MPNAIELLKQDHEKVKGLLEDLMSTSEKAVKTRTKVCRQIKEELEVHTRIEEEIFYPIFRDASRSKETTTKVFEATEEHNAATMVLEDLLATDVGTLEFSGKAKVLKELIEHHVEEEEDDMFPKMQEIIGEDELNEIGKRLMSRKKELMRGESSSFEQASP